MDWVFVLAIILACPLLHFLMVRGGHHHQGDEKGNKVRYQCPECGLFYKERQWAERCEVWCKKYKACSLKISKHALKKGGETRC